MFKDSLVATRRLSVMATAVLAGAALLVLVVYIATADTRIGRSQRPITISESSKTFSAKAGAVHKGSLVLTNHGDEEQQLIVYPRPFSVDNESYKLNFESVRHNSDAYQWLEFEKTIFTVKPGDSVTVSYTLRVPTAAKTGSHYGVIFAETSTSGERGDVSERRRIGQVLSVLVGDIDQSAARGEVKGFNLSAWQPRPPLISYATVLSTGTTDFEVKTNTTVKNLLGRTKHAHADTLLMLPGTERLVGMSWENAPSFGIYHVRQDIQFLGQQYQSDGYVFFTPRWFPIVLVLGVVMGGAYAAIYSRKK